MNEEIYARILANNRAETARRAQEEREAAARVEAQPGESTSMADFAASHRQEKLPSVQRRHQLIERERVALGGEPRREEF